MTRQFAARTLPYSFQRPEDIVSALQPTLGDLEYALNGRLPVGGLMIRGPRPWVDVRAFGARGNLVTNDSAAFQAAIDSLGALGGGTVLVPQGNYLLNTGLTISGRGIRILGDSAISPFLRTDTLGVTQWTITGAQNALHGLQIGLPSSTSGSNTGVAIALSGTVEGHVDNILAVGGANAVAVSGTSADCIISRCKFYDIYGISLVTISGPNGTGAGGLYLYRNKLDQNWPVSTPTTAQILGAWAATTAYTVGQTVTTQGWRIQCKTAGTSGSVAPTLVSYGADITDGTVTWLMAMPSSFAALNIDSNTFGLWGQWNDMTGALNYGVRIRNTLVGGAAPQKIILQENEIGSLVETGIKVDAGDGLILRGNTINNTINGDGIFLNNTTDGDVLIAENLMYGHSQYGIRVANGVTHTSILNNHLNANGTASVQIASDTTDFIIEGNNTNPAAGAWSGAQTIGIRVAAGTSNRYVIVGNFGFNNATPISDGGTGANKVVANNL